jgi:hypothetical protein
MTALEELLLAAEALAEAVDDYSDLARCSSPEREDFASDGEFFYAVECCEDAGKAAAARLSRTLRDIEPYCQSLSLDDTLDMLRAKGKLTEDQYERARAFKVRTLALRDIARCLLGLPAKDQVLIRDLPEEEKRQLRASAEGAGERWELLEGLTLEEFRNGNT